MLNLGSTSSTLEGYHQKFLDEGLPPELSREAFARFDASKYPAEAIEAGRDDWQLRTLDEYRSYVAFAEFIVELADVGFAWDVIGTSVRLVRDEMRHVELCRRMVRALGGSDEIPGEPGWVRSDPNLPLRQRALRTCVGSLCVGETLSVSMLNAVRQSCVDPTAKAVMTTLAADESIHSRFGWTLMEAFMPVLTDEERTDIDEFLPLVFGATIGAVLPEHVLEKRLTDSMAVARTPFGAIGDQTRIDLFYAQIEESVVRRFEAIGIPGRKLWEKRIAL